MGVNNYAVANKESAKIQKFREQKEYDRIQAAIKSPLMVDQSLEPLELPVFDPKIIEGLKFNEQQMARAKFMKEKSVIEAENKRRWMLREQISQDGFEELRKVMSQIKYERDLGIYPTTLVDSSLSQNLISN